MDAKEFKITKESKIFSIINQLILNKTSAIVWQNNNGPKELRNSVSAGIGKFSSDLKQIYLTPNQEKFKFH